MDARTAFLIKLAPQSAVAWEALGARAFRGEVTVETANRIYLFEDGAFLSRARKGGTFEAPLSMDGLRLIGFLADEGGLFSLSPRWRPGSHAVMWRPGPRDGASDDGGAARDDLFVLTSATTACTVPAVEVPAPAESGVALKGKAPPTLRRPNEGSLTRIHTR